MKKILLLCLLIIFTGSILVWRAVAKPVRFGTFSAVPRAQVSNLIANPKAFLDKTVDIQGTISQQCKSMGCYFFFRSGKEALRVDIQEVAMTAPLREGRTARVEGQIVPYAGGYQFSASAVEFQ